VEVLPRRKPAVMQESKIKKRNKSQHLIEKLEIYLLILGFIFFICLANAIVEIVVPR